MSSWNAMTYEGKDTILRVVRHEAEQFFAMVDSDEAWEAPTGAGHWQVRDLVGHIVDTTEAYFVAFDAARGGTEMPAAYGLPGMAARVDKMATALRSEPRSVLVERLRADFEQDDGDPRGAHRGRLVRPASSRTSTWARCRRSSTRRSSSWTTACTPGTSARAPGGRTGSPARSADLLVPFMFVLWKYTVAPSDAQPCELGIRITSGPNAGDTRVTVGPGGMDYAPGDVSDCRR